MFRSYLLVSSGGIAYYISFYNLSVPSFYTEKYKNIQTTQIYGIYCLLLPLATRVEYHIWQYGTYRSWS